MSTYEAQRHETRAQAFEEAAEEMDRLVEVMKEQQERVRRAGQRDWPGSYIADREGHAVWLRSWAEKERQQTPSPKQRMHERQEMVDAAFERTLVDHAEALADPRMDDDYQRPEAGQ